MKPFLLAMFGTSGSGKTTIGTRLDNYFKETGERKVQFIDGDAFRNRCDNIFGYTKEERGKVSKALNATVSYLLENNISVITAGVGAYKEQRRERRNAFPENFIECYVKCSFEECCRRDPKGYYKKFMSGELKNFNVSKVDFEEPENNEILVDTEILTPEQSVAKILEYIHSWEKEAE